MAGVERPKLNPLMYVPTRRISTLVKAFELMSYTLSTGFAYKDANYVRVNL